jgi:pimeloyl-ACP methyl ester carboxylesterase
MSWSMALGSPAPAPERDGAPVVRTAALSGAHVGHGSDRLAPVFKERHDEHGILTVEATRSQYVDGVPEPDTVNPDLWELDQRYLDMPGRDRVMLDLLFDYQSNVAAYPEWHEYLRTSRPPALLPWGRNDAFFPPAGADAYLGDLPDADIRLLDTGHFATATHSAEIAEMIVAFMSERNEAA